MANRYWVGGTGSWDGTAGTKWATTSGGAGGSAVPNQNDDVYFDGASGAVTVTVSANTRLCKDLNFTGFTGTFTGTGTITNISGSLILGSGMTWTHTGALTFQSTSAATITPNGIVIDNSVTVNKASGSLTLAGDFDIQQGSTLRVFTLTAGTFDTANYDFSCGQLGSNNSNVRTLTFGSSDIYLKGVNVNVWTLTTVTNLTINMNTAHFITTGVGTSGQAIGFDCNVAYTFYKITRTGATLGAWNLTNCVCADVNLPNVGVAHNVGILGTNGGDIALGSDVFIGDVSNPSVGILTLTGGTFDTNGFNMKIGRFSSSNANVRSFIMTSGDLELCSDGGIWNTTTQTNLSVNMGTTHVICSGTSSASARNISAYAGVVSFYKITRTSGSTSSSGFNFQGVVCPRVNMPATGVNAPFQITAASDVKLESDCVVGTTDGAFGIVISDSIFDTDGYDITCSHFQSTAAGTREIYLRDSVLNLYGNANASPTRRAVAFQNAAGLTFDAGTSTINFVGVSGVDTEIQSADKTFYNVIHNGTATPLRLTDAGIYNDISISAGETLQLTASVTQTIASITVPDDVENGISIESYTPATQATISIPSGYYNFKGVDFQDVVASGGAVYRAFVSNGNLDSGNNAGIDFGKGLAFCLMQ